MNNLLDEQPIAVPANPFWKVLKTFGRDEFLAGLISVVVTGAAELVLWMLLLPKTGGALLILAFIGPVFEKLGFFVGHIKDAYDIYRTTPYGDRKDFSHYAKNVLRGGGKSLLQDILVHDPIYIGLMLGGMWIHPATPAWLLVPVAFGVAVILVALGEVSVNELRYKLLKSKLSRAGFKVESYLEARFYITPYTEEPVERCVGLILESLKRQCFDFRNFDEKVFSYTDYYFETDLPTYNARTPRVRLRERVFKDKHFNSLQVVYTRAVEESEDQPEQYRFFPQRKHKFYLPLEEEDLSNSSNIESESTRLLLRKITTDAPVKQVNFARQAIYNTDNIFVAIDVIEDQGTKFIVVECKVYPGKEAKLKEAMRYVMQHYPVVQTTHGKFDLF